MKLRLVGYIDLAIEYSIYALIFYIPISIAIVSIFACMAVILFLIKQVFFPNFASVKSNKIFFMILCVFFIFMSASLLNSGPLIGKSLKALLMKWGRFPLMLWMIFDTFQDPRRILKAAGVFVLSSILVGISVFSQKFLGFEFLRHKTLWNGHVTGPFPGPIDLASYLVCVIPIVLCLGLGKWKWISIKISILLIAMALMISLFLTYCRGGWIGFTASLIFVVLVLNYHRIRKTIFWTLFWAGYIFCVPLIAIVLFFTKSDPPRIFLYQGAWKMIMEHPFLGKGLGTFMDYSVQYSNMSWPCYAHNCFLQIWAESGILSLLSFLALNGYVFYKTMKQILRMPKTLNFYILMGLFAGYFGLLAHCFFDTQLYSFQASMLFWVVMGLTVALCTNLEQQF